MRVEGTIHILREYNKWRRGKGRKYQAPSMPFDGETIGLTIDDAISKLNAYLKIRKVIEDSNKDVTSH